MTYRNFAPRIALMLSLVLAATGAWAAGAAYRLHVDGLACPFCAYGLEKKLGAVHGVRGVDTQIKDGTVTVMMEDGESLDETAARQAVKDAGFSLRKFAPVPPATPGEK